MDNEVNNFALKLSKYNPDTLIELKKALWNGTEDWTKTLEKRAEISGALVLSDFTKKALLKFKK